MMDYETWKKECDTRQKECLKEWENDQKYQIFWRRLIDIITEKGWEFRYKTIWDDSDETPRWNAMLFEPVECYIDSAIDGPAAKWEVEWLEINPIHEEYIGRLVPIRKTDCTKDICERLTSGGIEFSMMDHNIRINTQVSPISRRLMKQCEMWKREIKYHYFWRPTLINIIAEKDYNYRLKTIGNDEVSQWGWLVLREDFYIESEWHGPVPMWEIDWIEIDPIIEEAVGSDLLTERVDYTKRICGKLRKKGADFSIIDGKYVRVKTIPRK